MKKVNLDIAGMFYWRADIAVQDDATVFDVMDQASKLDNMPAHTGAKLSFSQELPGENSKFLNEISVLHRNDSAISRQQPTMPGTQPRVYPNGLFKLADEPITTGVNGKFVPAMRLPNGNLVEDPNKATVTAWQYYIYDRNFVDKNRANAGQKRSVTAFTESTKDYPLENGDTVVWRLITLILKANSGMQSIKGISEMAVS